MSHSRTVPSEPPVAGVRPSGWGTRAWHWDPVPPYRRTPSLPRHHSPSPGSRPPRSPTTRPEGPHSLALLGTPLCAAREAEHLRFHGQAEGHEQVPRQDRVQGVPQARPGLRLPHGQEEQVAELAHRHRQDQAVLLPRCPGREPPYHLTGHTERPGHGLDRGLPGFRAIGGSSRTDFFRAWAVVRIAGPERWFGWRAVSSLRTPRNSAIRYAIPGQTGRIRPRFPDCCAQRGL